MSAPTREPASSPDVTGVGLAHVALSVTDLDRARAFYRDVLGLIELPRPDFGLPGAWLAVGTAQLHLAVVPEITGRDPMGHVAFHVPTERVGPLTDAVLAAGGQVVMPARTRDDFGRPVTSAICRDSEGNLIELTDAAGTDRHG